MSAGSRRGGQALVLTAIVLLAINLRPAAVSVGPVLDDVRAGLGMSGPEAGLLTSLPVLAFALFGGLSAHLAAAIGRHRLIAVALACALVGLVARSRVHDVAAFLALSLLALAGLATANVVLPSLVKQHFPDRVGAVTAVYSTALAVGLTAASVLTVPFSDGGHAWRTGLGVWAVVAAVALVPWLGLTGRDARVVTTTDPAPSIGVGSVLRTRLGRLMALFFGLQSLFAYSVFGWLADIYRDAGFSSSTAGALLGVVTGISIPLSLLVPTLAGRMATTAPLAWGLIGCYPVGFLGLVFAPHAGAWVWAVLIGIAGATFPLVLTLIGLRARTAEGTASLSASTQAVGYLIAAVGPFGAGALHDLSGSWTLPLLVLTALTVPLLLVALATSRPAFIEDQLA